MSLHSQEHQKEFEPSRAPATVKYLLEIHEQMKDSYENFNCGVVADKIARKLIMDDEISAELVCIMNVYEEVRHPVECDELNPLFPPFRTEIKKILPTQYKGKMEPWHSHLVCCAGEYAFDPIIGEPVHISQYTQRLCESSIEMKVQETGDTIRRKFGIDSRDK